MRSSTREVIVASNDKQLYPGDTVQTQADGRARINMADGSTVVLMPNNTIIIRDNASAEDGKRSNVHVVVDSCQMVLPPQRMGEGPNVNETPNTHTEIAGQSHVNLFSNPIDTQ